MISKCSVRITRRDVKGLKVWASTTVRPPWKNKIAAKSSAIPRPQHLIPGHPLVSIGIDPDRSRIGLTYPILAEGNPSRVAYLNPFGTEQGGLQFPAVSRRKGDTAIGADNTVPGQILGPGQGMEDPDDLTGAVGESRG
jgi:hypothetical protein